MGKKLYNIRDKKLLRMEIAASNLERKTLSFYNYIKVSDPQLFRDELYKIFLELNVLGRVYIASEGINAQLSVPVHNTPVFLKETEKIPFLSGVRINWAVADNGKSFFKLDIRVREKIVADGLKKGDYDIEHRGKHINAMEFNELANKQDATVVDMRNNYESEIGHFKNAICPSAESFREAIPEVESIIETLRDQNIILYCTGGIRCEKASSYFLKKGYDNIYQLEGGIIEYCRQVKEQGLENHFVGKNFVFDDRLGERISEDIISQCHQCGQHSDQHRNCANDSCHLLFIQCDSCAEKYASCCSRKCADFIKLPQEQKKSLRKSLAFNGTKNRKGTMDIRSIDEPLRTD